VVPESYSERNAPRICEVSFILFVLILIETEVTQRNHVFFTCYSDLIWALFFENNVKWCVSGLIGIYSEFTGRGVGENDRTSKS